MGIDMTIDMIQTIYDYHYARHRELWDSIMTLDEAQFVQDVPYSWGSLRNHMVHMIDDDAKWFALLREKSEAAQLRPEDFVSRAEVRAVYDKTEADILNFINKMDVAILQQTFIWHPAPAIETRAVRGWQVLLHVVNHGTDHRAGMLRILHDSGAPTFDQDLMGYLVQTGQTTIKK